jgi:hypothetical protein
MGMGEFVSKEIKGAPRTPEHVAEFLRINSNCRVKKAVESLAYTICNSYDGAVTGWYGHSVYWSVVPNSHYCDVNINIVG